MHKCLLTYKYLGELKETFLFYKEDISEALKKFFLFNNKKDIEIVSLQLKQHYPNYMDIEETIYLPTDDVLKEALKNL